MSVRDDKADRQIKVQADEVSSLRARDVQHISASGIDVGIAEEVPATSRDALHDRVKVVQRERFHTLLWYAVFIVILLVLTVVLGIQLL